MTCGTRRRGGGGVIVAQSVLQVVHICNSLCSTSPLMLLPQCRTALHTDRHLTNHALPPPFSSPQPSFTDLFAGSSRHEQSVSKRFSMNSCSRSSTGSLDLKPARHTSSVSTPFDLDSRAWLDS